MSRYYAERAVLSAGSLGLVDFLDRHVVRPVLAWRGNHVTRRELMALDDRQLADIGLGRGEIGSVAFDGRRA